METAILKQLRVLIACEESQAVCIEFRKLGHIAFSCDLQPCSGGHPEWHAVADCLSLINGNCKFKTQTGQTITINGQWDLIIAHPPCTYLTKAGAVRMYTAPGIINDARYKKMLKARYFFYQIFNAQCKHIAIENPIPLKIADLPPKTTYIQPSWFGHPYTKQTCLWLKNLPVLIPSCYCTRTKSWTAIKKTAKARSKTFTGIAAAMATQWAAYLQEEKTHKNLA